MVEKADTTRSTNIGSDPAPVGTPTSTVAMLWRPGYLTTAFFTGKSSPVTRSWAVERVLRKNLVVVPPPVRVGSKSPAQENATSKAGAIKESTKESTQSPRSIPVAPESESVHQRPTAYLTLVTPPGSDKQDSPRHPASTSMVAGSQTLKRAHTQYPPPHIPKEVKSASLLKLVGASETKGRSKEELVDDYKRARRAELEAMLRTMVHQ
jgi:hypothetical protein